MNTLCDLHTHSVFSDGTDTPAQLIRGAMELGLGAIALCDHNTIAGLPEFLAAARGKNIQAVPGIEFSTDYHGTELHILGLFIQPEHYEKITALLEDTHRRKEESNLALAQALNRAGFTIDYPTMKAKTPEGQINRAHFAAELAAQGYVPTIQEAFRSLLKPYGDFYIPPKRLDPFETIAFIKSIGAVAVLAHPFLNLDEARLRIFLAEAVKHGLDGMETLYPLYDADTTRTAAAVAKAFGLKPSGGSDYHGDNKPDIRLGCGRGDLAVPMRILEQLKPY